MDKSEQVIVAMGALVFMVALKEGWLPYLRAWVTSSVGGPGVNTLTDAGKAAGSVTTTGDLTSSVSPQAAATAKSGVNLITNIQ